ncbi:ATPase, T2SS/T4P/T4SS family [Alcanivorax sp.]|uniref:ATPase, T2SS/T4P/T4SS family n=1 Tax=Alcanivorax sp. TaxID=1872427 RepID=UPI0025BBFDE2|nr:ATPase, T2SS/T4P/T4SS family [Alcanivorax sp.]
MASKAAQKNVTFIYEGTDRKGTKVKGEATGKAPSVVKAELRKQGINAKKVVRKREIHLGGKKKIKPMDIALFTRQMATMMKAGVPLVQAFEIVADGLENPSMKELVLKLKVDVEGGNNFAGALSKHPDQFDDLYCSLIDAGEQSGALETMLDRVAIYKEKSEALKMKIKKAMKYPMVVVGAAVIVTAILLLKVVPVFEELFAGFGAELPAFTQFVIGLSKGLQANFLFILVGIIVFVIGFTQLKKRSTAFANSLDRMILKMPIVGDLAFKSTIARYARTLSTTFSAGVPLIEALDACARWLKMVTSVERMDLPIFSYRSGLVKVMHGVKEDVGGLQLQLQFACDPESGSNHCHGCRNIASKLSARLKVMSRLDISERRVPQDGRIKLKISKTRAIDFRVNTCPTLFGEKIVLRILDPESAKMGIDALGYDEDQKQLYMDALQKPQGMILVTGPTGSGKTVSLYTGVNILNTPERNISTAEDPVEINLEGVNQVNVNPKQGMDFSAALRAFLRQDPDVILVGEIRDLETANIAIKAAQTGHLVLSTLHTNSAPETLTRLRNMGVPSFNIATSVILIIAQRLARRLCEHCKTQVDIPKQSLLEMGFTDDDLGSAFTVYGPQGCDKCKNGYKGRVGIYEVVKITDGISRIIMEEGNSLEIGDQCRKDGFNDLYRSGLVKVMHGVTSLEEVSRVTSGH